MQGATEYSLCYGTPHPHPMQESNPRLPSDFDPRAPSPHFSRRDAAPFNGSTEAPFFPSLVHFPNEAQAATLRPGLDDEPTKVDKEKKEHAADFCHGGFDGLIGSESSASRTDGQQEALRKLKMSSSVSPSKAEKQHASSTPTGLGRAAMTGISEPACIQGSFLPSDQRFHTDAHSLRRFCPMTDRNNPYIDALKMPSWPQLHVGLEPAGTGYSFPGEEWSTYGTVGKCPSFGALPNYLHHHPGYQSDQQGVFQPTFHSNSISQQRARNAAAFLPDQLQPPAGGTAVDYSSSVGLFGSVDACSTDQGAGIYERGMWPSGYRIEEGHWASDRLVGKSQSMRALYCCHKEENEALRRALYSMRRAADHETQFPGAEMDLLPAAPAWAKNQLERVPLQEEAGVDARNNARFCDRRQDPYISRDAAEGRTVSMRERGRWGEQDQAGGGTAGGGHGYSYPIWSMEGARGEATRKQMHECWCREDGDAAFYGGHRLYMNGGARGEGRWQEAENQWLRWGDEWRGREAAGEASRPKTWQTIGVGGATWDGGSGGAGGSGLTVKEQLAREGIGGTSTAAGVDESRCAMCDGKLRRLRNPSATKKLGLPLRLCPACHPRAAASLPPSTTKSPTPTPPPPPPPLRPSSASARARHHAAASVATVISMACKPNIAASSASRKKSKTRIVDLCRHLVGLSMKPSAA